ncbi:MAG TPA: rRNA pseudouridine synthase [Clostridiales bacterium]|nr:rRNA pseudouridine synthase [Clostridiales bacterium]
MMRLQKYMAYCGVASRRKCEDIIAEGRVSVNGYTITDMGVKINPRKDIVKVDGITIEPEDKKIYIALNKPVGYISSVCDQFGRPTVLDLVDRKFGRLYPVGRLDYDSEGLILLTNDGDLAYRLTHPKFNISKEYNVEVDGLPTPYDIDKLRKGIFLEGRKTRPAIIELLKQSKNSSTFMIILKEGRNRQIRKMFDFIGHSVISLQRVRIANILLGNMQPGEWRHLTDEEIVVLKNNI